MESEDDLCGEEGDGGGGKWWWDWYRSMTLFRRCCLCTKEGKYGLKADAKKKTVAKQHLTLEVERPCASFF